MTPCGIRRERAKGNGRIKEAIKRGHNHEKDPKLARGDKGSKWEFILESQPCWFPKEPFRPCGHAAQGPYSSEAGVLVKEEQPRRADKCSQHKGPDRIVTGAGG